MKLSRLNTILIIAMALAMGISLRSGAPESKAAFGTSPPWVRNDHLLPGTTFEQIINLSRNNPDTEMQVTVRLDGDKEILKWVKIVDKDELIMKKGQEVLPMKVIVKIPRRAALKDYRGGIFVTLEPLQTGGSQQGGTVAIKLGAHISVELSVIGEKVEDYRVNSISLLVLEEGEPFRFNVDVLNLGNTEITELDGQIDIYDANETRILKSLTFGSLTEPISPDEKITSQVIFEQFILDPGDYWVVVKVFKDGEVTYENRLFQKVNEEYIPVITPEDVLSGAETEPKRPGIPGTDEDTGELTIEPVLISETPGHTAAPEIPVNKYLLIFGIVGLSFGLIALVVVIVLLVVLIRRQRQATIQQYLSHHTHK